MLFQTTDGNMELTPQRCQGVRRSIQKKPAVGYRGLDPQPHPSTSFGDHAAMLEGLSMHIITISGMTTMLYDSSKC